MNNRNKGFERRSARGWYHDEKRNFLSVELAVMRAMQNINRVWEESSDCLQRFDRARRAAGQVHNNGLSANYGDGTRQNRAWGLFQSGGAHLLRKPRNASLRHLDRGLRSYVARPDASAPGGEHQIGLIPIGSFFQECCDDIALVREIRGFDNLPTQSPASRLHCGPRPIRVFSGGYRIADGENDNSHEGRRNN